MRNGKKHFRIIRSFLFSYSIIIVLPLLVGVIAYYESDAKFIMDHGGATAKAMEEALVVINSHDNAYINIAISMVPQGNIEWLVKEAGSKKILFGTDMPYFDPRPTFGRVAMVDISNEEKRDIFGLNAKRLFNI